MAIDNLSKIHEIRKAWQTARSEMFLTCQKINELEESLAQARADKRMLQQKLTTLEVDEKLILGEIKPCKPAKTVFKTDLEKAITKFVRVAFFNLSKEDKASMVEKLLNDAMK